LREAGPDVGCSRESVGGIAIAVLNRGLRPFVSKWHALLHRWENQRDPKISRKEHESCWPKENDFLAELNALRDDLDKYANALAAIAGGIALVLNGKYVMSRVWGSNPHGLRFSASRSPGAP